MSLFALLILMSTTPVSIYASNEETQDGNEFKESVDLYLSKFDDFDEENIDVVKELTELKEEYINQLRIENDPIILDQINVQIDSVENMINLYEGRNYTTLAAKGTKCSTYNDAVSAITVYFKLKGYTVSRDLLTFGYYTNTSTSKSYQLNSSHINKIRQTSWYTKAKNAWPSAYGSDRFTSGDLYYAINKFNYNSGTQDGIVYLYDTYDYDADTSYPSIQGVAVNAMLGAQLSGCLIPFKVRATINTR